jgi:hypothetical protein
VELADLELMPKDEEVYSGTILFYVAFLCTFESKPHYCNK